MVAGKIRALFLRWIARIKKLFQKYEKVFLLLGVSIILIFACIDLFLILSPRQDSDLSLGICTKTPPAKPSATPNPKIQEFGLQIEKLDILVPITKDVNGKDKTAYNDALKEGVAHFKGTSLPGEDGNIFIFGHSSTEIKGEYSEIFAKLNDLEINDPIVVFYQNAKHKYKVKQKKIVEATDLSVLDKGSKEILTLMTCWPIGTKDKRLIILAEPE